MTGELNKYEQPLHEMTTRDATVMILEEVGRAIANQETYVEFNEGVKTQTVLEDFELLKNITSFTVDPNGNKSYKGEDAEQNYWHVSLSLNLEKHTFNLNANKHIYNGEEKTHSDESSGFLISGTYDEGIFSDCKVLYTAQDFSEKDYKL